MLYANLLLLLRIYSPSFLELYILTKIKTALNSMKIKHFICIINITLKTTLSHVFVTLTFIYANPHVNLTFTIIKQNKHPDKNLLLTLIINL